MTCAFVFPGQGSQTVGMLAALAERHPLVKETFAEAADALGYDLWALVAAGPADRLNLTKYTQPAMLTAGVALWRVWTASRGAMPAVCAGHSLGEYTALVCAESIELKSAARLVAARGRFMQECVAEGEGAIAAVLGLADEDVEQICRSAATQSPGRVVSAVNFNAPGQVAIAGHADAVDVAIALAKKGGARRAVMLPMSVPVHCSLMRPAATRLRALLDEVDVHAPAFPIIHNADLETHADAPAIRAALEAQLYTPVRWSATAKRLTAYGVEAFVECGPGRVLGGLNKRIDKSVPTFATADPQLLEIALNEVKG